jgi:hypothetical protein
VEEMVLKPPEGNCLLCINAVHHLGLNMKGGLQDNMIGSAQIKKHENVVTNVIFGLGLSEYCFGQR